MSKTPVSTPDAPAALGPYSQAVKAGGFVFCSGAIPINPKTGELVTGTITEQTNRCLENLKAVLTKAGSSLHKVVKVNVYLRDMNDFGEMNAEYGKFFDPECPPARAAVQVARLPKDVGIEIECIALE